MEEETLSRTAEPGWRECPSCQASVPVHVGYVTWCDRCGWNLDPRRKEASRNVFESVARTLGQKQSQVLFRRFSRLETLRPTLSASKLLAYVFAAVIHGITLAFALGGVTLLVWGWPYLLAILAGLLCIGIAWTLRPRFAEAPSETVPRKDWPALFQLVDRVAEALDAGSVDMVCVNERFSASFYRAGWRRRRVLCLGLPLWDILDPQEKVALIGHELAHDVNGDPNRGIFVGSAIYSLQHWEWYVRPDYIWPPHSGLTGMLSVPFNLVLYGLSLLFRLAASLLALLLWRDMQRAEYLADYLAAAVGGTEAMLSMLEKLHLEGTFMTTLHRIALNRDPMRDFSIEFRQRLDEIPARELERVRRLQEIEHSRLDVTHPPTIYRIQALQAHRPLAPTVELSSADRELLEEEFSTIRAQVQSKLIEGYRRTLYR